jgi:hypothetical protein
MISVIFTLIIILIITVLFLVKLHFQDRVKCPKPLWQPGVWNDMRYIKKNNCYSYALMNHDKSRKKKMYPGELSGQKKLKKGSPNYMCPNFEARIKKDIPGVLDSDPTTKCPCGYYKMSMFLDRDGDKQDFHFYREDADGTWSHKPGSFEVTSVDASNNKITNPSAADRDYSKIKEDGYNYNIGCGYYCVPYDHEYNNTKN